MRKDNATDNLGGIIKSARIANKLTQKELSAMLDVSTRYLKAIENSGQKPSYKLLKSIVAILDIPAGVMFKEEDQQGGQI